MYIHDEKPMCFRTISQNTLFSIFDRQYALVQKHCYIIEEQEDLLVIATCMLTEWEITGGTVDRY